MAFFQRGNESENLNDSEMFEGETPDLQAFWDINRPTSTECSSAESSPEDEEPRRENRGHRIRPNSSESSFAESSLTDEEPRPENRRNRIRHTRSENSAAELIPADEEPRSESLGNRIRLTRGQDSSADEEPKNPRNRIRPCKGDDSSPESSPTDDESRSRLISFITFIKFPSRYLIVTVALTVAVFWQITLNFLDKNQDSDYFTDSQTGQRWYSALNLRIGNYGLGIIQKNPAKWSTWSEYNDCSVTCGNGIRTRTRVCINASPGNRGCHIGEEAEQITCSKEKCIFWSTWSEYSECSVTCGDGIKTRQRNCINASPGQQGCHIGDAAEQIYCSKEKCAFWSSWSKFSDCSVTCGDGVKTRKRECMNGSPGQQGCHIGDTVEQMSCSKETCAFWSTWSEYSDCSVTCGDGIKIKQRECMNGSPGQYGCHIGDTIEQISCSKEKCMSWSEIFGSCIMYSIICIPFSLLIVYAVNHLTNSNEKKEQGSVRRIPVDNLTSNTL